MALFSLLLTWFVTTIVGELLRPKPKIENAKAAKLSDFGFPTATEARAVPVLWGTREIAGPNVVWFGDFVAQPVTEKVKTGLFSKKRVTVGYRYYVSLHLGLCHGPVTSILKVRAGDDTVWTGTSGPSATLTISKPSLWGGDKSGGGLDGTLELLGGESSQTAHAYLQGHIPDVPAYRGLQAALWRGYIGTTSQPRPFKITARRLPNGLASGVEDVGGGANPAEALFELLTDPVWGAGIPPGKIDQAGWRTVAQTLATEGNGLHLLWSGRQSIQEVAQTILAQIDGALYIDHQTGLWSLALVRGGYSVSSLPLYDESNVAELRSYSRGAWDETTNEVRVRFQDRAADDAERYAAAQDTANIQTQGGVVSSEQTFPGVGDGALASEIAARELRAMSYPLARVVLSAHRSASGLRPGDLFRLSWAELGVTDMPMRVTKIGFGELTAGTVTIEAVEDQFARGVATYGAPQPSGWVDPVGPAQAVVYQRQEEAPAWFVTHEITGTQEADLTGFGDQGVVLFQAEAPTGAHSSFDLQALPPGGSYEFAEFGIFTPSTTLTAAIGYTDPVLPVTPGVLLLGLEVGQLVEVDGEFMRVTYLDLANGQISVTRGHLDTVPQPHAAGARIWCTEAGATLDPNIYGAGAVVYHRAVTRTAQGELDPSSATVAGPLTIQSRANRPYPPQFLRVNGDLWPTVQDGPDMVLDWVHRNRLTQIDIDVPATSNNSYTPETGTTYTVEVWGGQDENTLALVRQISGAYYGLALTNPGAETGDTTGWTTTVGSLAVRSTNPDPYSGSYYFFGGAQPDTNAEQIVPVSAPTTEIDAGQATLDVQWHQSSFSGSDKAEIIVEALDGAQNPLASQAAGLVSYSTWTKRTLSMPLPALTRYVKIEMHMQRAAGTNNDGYIDEISASISTGVATTSFTYSQADEIADGGPYSTLRFTIKADRAGVVSWQQQDLTLDRAGYGYHYGNYYGGA